MISDSKMWWLAEKLRTSQERGDKEVTLTTEDYKALFEAVGSHRREIALLRDGVRGVARNLNAMAKE